MDACCVSNDSIPDAQGFAGVPSPRMSNPRRLGLLARGWDGRSLAFSFVDPAVGVLVFAAASILKDTVNRISPGSVRA